MTERASRNDWQVCRTREEQIAMRLREEIEHGADTARRESSGIRLVLMLQGHIRRKR